MPEPGRQRNLPEAVAVFDDVASLDAAVDALQAIGVGRADIAMLADEATVEAKIGNRFWRAEALEDNPDAPRRPYFAEESYGAAEGAVLGAPMYVAAVATAGALASAGAAMTPIIAAGVLAGGAGAAVGALLAWLVGARHARYLSEQIGHGGLLLWVRVWDPEKQVGVLDILTRHSGRDAHLHGWTVPE